MVLVNRSIAPDRAGLFESWLRKLKPTYQGSPPLEWGRFCFIQSSGRLTRLPRACKLQMERQPSAVVSKPRGTHGRVKMNVLPTPGWLSTRIRPPARSRIRRQMASPSPVPETVFWSLLKRPKMYSEYCGSNPMPLSATVIVTWSLFSAARIWMTGGRCGSRYFRLLPIRF